MNKILVTGSSGFVGSYVMELFPDAIGYDVKNSNKDNILNKQHLFRILKKNKTDTIIHLAAYVSVADSEKQPQIYKKNNIEGTMCVVGAAIKAGVGKIIYASSSASSQPTSSIYALTKYVPELILDCFKDEIDTVSLRFFNIYGKGSNPVYGRVIDNFIKGTKRGRIIIHGDGKQTRDFIHARDVARAIKLAVEKKITSGSVIDIGTGKTTSVNRLAVIIGELMQKQPRIIYDDPRKEVRYSKADLTKARHLSFKPGIDLREGLRDLL